MPQMHVSYAWPGNQERWGVLPTFLLLKLNSVQIDPTKSTKKSYYTEIAW